MTHDHQRRSAGARPTTTGHDGAATPGKISRSAQLIAPDPAGAPAAIQRSARDAGGVAEGAEHAVAAAAPSSGAPLPALTLRSFQTSLGADLSAVRVHTGGASERAAAAVGAKAYTVGNDIHFGAGHYDPASAGGQHLLAHEVAHTVQQSGGAAPRAQCKLEVSSPGDGLEVEADRAADAMVVGGAAAVSAAAGLARSAIQRASVDGGQPDGGIAPDPPPPDPRWEVTERIDETGARRRSFRLKQPEAYFVAYGQSSHVVQGQTEQCYYPARDTQSKVSGDPLVEGQYLQDPPQSGDPYWPPRLNVYSDHKADPKAGTMSLGFTASRTEQVLAYLKSSLDSGRPLIVGVNEDSKIATMADATGKPKVINSGITNHYVVITGYDAVYADGKWSVTGVNGIDNATADKTNKASYPQFTVQPDGGIVKPGAPGAHHYAHDATYVITEVRVYKRDVPAQQSSAAWYGPSGKLKPVPPPPPPAGKDGGAPDAGAPDAGR